VPSQSSVRWAHAALLFGACGAASSQLFDHLGDWGVFVFPIPFGLAAAWITVGSVVPGLALVILDAAVWLIAFRMAAALAANGSTLQTIVGIYLAGLIGGLGVGLATALVMRQAPAMRAVGMGALAGGVCGLPFAWWVIAGNQVPIPEWAFSTLCFTIWQAAVGVCLWRGFRVGKPEPRRA